MDINEFITLLARISFGGYLVYKLFTYKYREIDWPFVLVCIRSILVSAFWLSIIPGILLILIKLFK